MWVIRSGLVRLVIDAKCVCERHNGQAHSWYHSESSRTVGITGLSPHNNELPSRLLCGIIHKVGENRCTTVVPRVHTIVLPHSTEALIMGEFFHIDLLSTTRSQSQSYSTPLSEK